MARKVTNVAKLAKTSKTSIENDRVKLLIGIVSKEDEMRLTEIVIIVQPLFISRVSATAPQETAI